LSQSYSFFSLHLPFLKFSCSQCNILFFKIYIIYTLFILKILLFLENNLKNKKALQQIPKSWKCQAPQTDDYSTFCMSEDAEKVYQKLEEAINT